MSRRPFHKATLTFLALCVLLAGCNLSGNTPGGSDSTLHPLYQTVTALASASGLDLYPDPTITPNPDYTATPVIGGRTPPPEITPGDTPDYIETPILYYAQAGDTLEAVAARFSVQPEEIACQPLTCPAASELLDPNTTLMIPRQLANTTSSHRILPDSEVVFSAIMGDFDLEDFINEAGGYLSEYNEWLASTGNTNGAEVIARVAQENSINPRLLLALLQHLSNWVYGEPRSLSEEYYPMGYYNNQRKGLYRQMVWAINNLSTGYYSWRAGTLTQLEFQDGVVARIAPDLNAGTVALQYYFAQLYGNGQTWVQALDPQNGLPGLYEEMFGNPWLRAVDVEPLYPAGLSQPEMILPFQRGVLWAYTGGPHGAWEHEGALAALDFAPATDTSGCYESYRWVVATASGRVTRSGNGVVAVDLDGDGNESTGWVVIYLHIADNGRVPHGLWVDQGDYIGHPSCEGGISTGTHLHIARKFNGEWIAADGPVPFVMSGWTPHAGSQAYKGTLTRDGMTVIASTVGAGYSNIMRELDVP